MSNEELIIRIQAGIDTADNMARLWQQVEQFVKKVANRYKGYAEFDDLMQEGYLGVNAAVEHWRQSEGGKFLSYAAYWIKQFMTRYIESSTTMRLPSNQYQRIRQYKKLIGDFKREYGREPTKHESCHFLEISGAQYEALGVSALRSEIGTLDKELSEDGEQTIGDLLPGDTDIESEVLNRVQQRELKETIWSLVDALPDQQREVIHLRYEHGMTLKSSGEQAGVTPERARQVERQGLRTLSQGKSRRQLMPYIEDYIKSRAYYGGAESFKRTWTSSTERTALDVIERNG